eukprot:gnl/TRDRNA2_/TRDRNA2_155668_c1_seq4.p1 gnl/TRDRNA2_/TRDRNA2_155668_c1~~gnl/TRDRNA2_/TRDRNA2_155668_c1_seq4.p1  ORF type:complete len:166 (+),score=15.25 gnl/TRDRNA2_/TRDRNA2_155668_c1_seq4:39-500(+)
MPHGDRGRPPPEPKTPWPGRGNAETLSLTAAAATGGSDNIDPADAPTFAARLCAELRELSKSPPPPSVGSAASRMKEHAPTPMLDGRPLAPVAGVPLPPAPVGSLAPSVVGSNASRRLQGRGNLGGRYRFYADHVRCPIRGEKNSAETNRGGA